MNAWMWTAFALASAVYATVSVTKRWRREHALTAQCRANEQTKTEALRRQTAKEPDPTEETT